jgi:hypothetical protein
MAVVERRVGECWPYNAQPVDVQSQNGTFRANRKSSGIRDAIGSLI